MNLFELFVKIGMDTVEADKGLANITQKIGNGLKTAAQIGIGAITAASTAIVALTKKSIDSYAEYEQLTGGVETLFEDIAWEVQENAAKAYKTAGLSANEYMDTVMGFSASLTNSLIKTEGNMGRAAEVANQTIIDMADNANKMGTSMESIQNAYQGFAKQNYTMLDNLKLGYGGTATEMARLVNDSGILGDKIIDLSDTQKIGAQLAEVGFSRIAEAIHIVQTEMRITGTTALEANETISGSIGSLSAAWENLITGLSESNPEEYDVFNIDELIENVVVTAETAFTNLMPVIEQALTGIGTLIEMITPIIAEKLPTIIENVLPLLINAATSLVNGIITALPTIIQVLIEQVPTVVTQLVSAIVATIPIFIETAKEIITNLINSIKEKLPEIIETGKNLIENLSVGLLENRETLIQKTIEILTNLIDKIREYLPEVLSLGSEYIANMTEGLSNNLPMIVSKITEIVNKVVNIIIDHLPKLLSLGGEFIIKMATGVLNNLPTIITAISNILSNLISTIMRNLPEFLAKGVEIVGKLIEGILNNLPNILLSLRNLLSQLILTIVQNLPQFLQQGIELIGSIIAGIVRNIPNILNTVWDIIGKLTEAFQGFDWAAIGSNLIHAIGTGIGNAIGDLVDAAVDAARSAFEAAKNFLGIHSPSKKFKFIGEMLDEGFAEGIDNNTDKVTDSVENLADLTTVPFDNNSSTNSNNKSVSNSIVLNVYGSQGQDIYELANEIEKVLSDTLQRREMYAL